MEQVENKLVFKSLGIDTDYDNVVYISGDCDVCRSENFQVLDRVEVFYGQESVVATVHIVSSSILSPGEISVSKHAQTQLGVTDGAQLRISYLPVVQSLSHIRSKIYGNKLSKHQMEEIVEDISKGNYSNVHLSAFIVSCATGHMDTDEVIHLTEAMIASGRLLRWNSDMVVDKHCIGGLPGNRTTPIVVAIAAACGLTMPKTSSRAITSPAGTADTMEVLTKVDLTSEEIQKVVTDHGGCVVWGGTSDLSPADDMLIKIEKALDIDSNAQLIASVLSKKMAAGSKYVVIDIPTGETAKVRSDAAAQELKTQMEQVAQAIGLKLEVLITDGSQPVGRGIGPALEARDVLSVLKNDPEAPLDLKSRALNLAARLLEMSGKCPSGKGNEKALEVLQSGEAYNKFKSFCQAQGRFTEPQPAEYTHEVRSEVEGVVKRINNRKIAKIAKLAGAPESPSSGVDFLSPVGKQIEKGQILYVVHAESSGELQYALDYIKNEGQHKIITIE